MDYEDSGRLRFSFWIHDEGVDGAVSVLDGNPFLMAGGFRECFRLRPLRPVSEDGRETEQKSRERARVVRFMCGIFHFNREFETKIVCGSWMQRAAGGSAFDLLNQSGIVGGAFSRFNFEMPVKWMRVQIGYSTFLRMRRLNSRSSPHRSMNACATESDFNAADPESESVCASLGGIRLYGWAGRAAGLGHGEN